LGLPSSPLFKRTEHFLKAIGRHQFVSSTYLPHFLATTLLGLSTDNETTTLQRRARIFWRHCWSALPILSLELPVSYPATPTAERAINIIVRTTPTEIMDKLVKPEAAFHQIHFLFRQKQTAKEFQRTHHKPKFNNAQETHFRRP
jgi:hypothetical protein